VQCRRPLCGGNPRSTRRKRARHGTALGTRHGTLHLSIASAPFHGRGSAWVNRSVSTTARWRWRCQLKRSPVATNLRKFRNILVDVVGENFQSSTYMSGMSARADVLPPTRRASSMKSISTSREKEVLGRHQDGPSLIMQQRACGAFLANTRARSSLVWIGPGTEKAPPSKLRVLSCALVSCRSGN